MQSWPASSSSRPTPRPPAGPPPPSSSTGERQFESEAQFQAANWGRLEGTVLPGTTAKCVPPTWQVYSSSWQQVLGEHWPAPQSLRPEAAPPRAPKAARLGSSSSKSPFEVSCPGRGSPSLHGGLAGLAAEPPEGSCPADASSTPPPQLDVELVIEKLKALAKTKVRCSLQIEDVLERYSPEPLPEKPPTDSVQAIVEANVNVEENFAKALVLKEVLEENQYLKEKVRVQELEEGMDRQASNLEALLRERREAVEEWNFLWEHLVGRLTSLLQSGELRPEDVRASGQEDCVTALLWIELRGHIQNILRASH